MVPVKHIRQSNDGHNWKCGSACLEMIFDFFKVEYDAGEIWNTVRSRRRTSRNQWFSLTYKLASYAISKCLYATIYKGTSSLDCLTMLDELGTPAILSIMQKQSGQSHFVVYTGIKNGLYYFCDPDISEDFSCVSDADMKSIWAPNPAIDVTGYIFIAFNRTPDFFRRCAHCGQEVPIVHSQLESVTQRVICPYCDHFVEDAYTYRNNGILSRYHLL